MKTFLIFILFFISFNCFSQEVRIKLHDCDLDQETFSDIKNALIFQANYYSVLFGDETKNSFKARIFGSKKDFLKFSKEEADFNPNENNTIAFYDHDLKEMIMHTEIKNFTSTFSHELSHTILNHYCPEIETWLDEGMAEFFEDLKATDSTYYFDKVQLKKIHNTREYFLKDSSIEIPIETNDFYEGVSHENYTISWSIVYYLYVMHKDLLHELITGDCEDKFKAVETIDLIYPGGFQSLKIDVRSYFLNYHFSAD